MKQKKFLLIIVLIFTLACAKINFSQAEPTFMPFPTVMPIPSTLPPTQAVDYTPLTIYPQATPLPEWVTEFAGPILEAIKNERPIFQDDFSTYRSWFKRNSGENSYEYAERFEEKLLLTLNEDSKESVFYTPRYLNRKNFVLTLDLRFYHNQPEDTIRFQFDGFENEHVAFDLTNNRSWMFHWKSENTLQNISDTYPHFPPDHIPVTIIMLERECAVYLNNDPLVYVNDCRELPTDKKFENWLTSFHLLRSGNHKVLINIDNLKLWDLDRIK